MLRQEEYVCGLRLRYNAEARGASYKNEHGWTGTIIRVSLGGNITIRWDDGKGERTTSTGSWWELADKAPTKEEVQAALALLKRAGDVTFKPKLKPFNQSIKLNDNHTAYVTVSNAGEAKVTVGCQTFSFSVVEQLAKVVANATAHIKEQRGD